MSFGMILLLALALLIIFGVGQRVLDRLRLSDRAALLAMAAIFIGGLIPNLTIGPVTFSLGGAVVPFLLCLWVLARADTGKDVARGLFGAALTAVAIYWLGRLLPADPESTVIDPNYIYGISAGIIAYVLGRSRRGAFVSAILGLLACDVFIGVMNWRQGIQQQIQLGTAGMLDAVVISGLLAVLLAELIGEAIERMTRGRGRQENEDGAVRDGRRAR